MAKYHKLAGVSLATLSLLTAMSLTTVSADSLNAKQTNSLGLTQKSNSLRTVTDNSDQDYSNIDVSNGDYINVMAEIGESSTSSVTFHGTSRNKIALSLESTRQIDVVSPSGKVLYHRDEFDNSVQNNSLVQTVLTLNETGNYKVKYQRTSSSTADFNDKTGIYPVLSLGSQNSKPAVQKTDKPKNGDYGRYAIENNNRDYSLDFNVKDNRTNPDPDDNFYDNYPASVFGVTRYYQDGTSKDLDLSDDDGSRHDTNINLGKSNQTTILHEKSSAFDVVNLKRYTGNNDGSDDKKYPATTTIKTELYTPKSGDGIKDKLSIWNFFDRIKSYLADPVDTASGAFQDQRTILSYSGNNPLALTLSYNSITNDSRVFKGGYSTNFDIYVDKSDSLVNVHWGNQSVTQFKQNGDGSYTAVDNRQNTTHLSYANKVYTLTTDDGDTYTFNAKNNISKHVSKTGTVDTFKYNSNNQLSSVSNNRGQSFTFGYDYNDILESVTDGTKRKVTFEYDSNDRLSTINTDDDKSYNISYSYINGKIDNLTYDGNQLVRNYYDGKGRVSEQVGDNGIETDFSYDESANDGLITTVDNSKSKTVVKHDLNGNLLSSKDGNGHTTSYTYDKDGNKLSETNGAGETTKFDYNSKAHLIKQTSPTGLITSFDYDDDDSQISKITMPDNKTATFKYSNHQLVQSTDKSGKTTNYTYDSFGNPLTIVKGNQNVTNTYDSKGYLVSLTKNGNKTTFTNDKLGRPIVTTLPDGSSIKTTYDNHGNVLKTTKSDGSSTTNEYDAFGNVTKSTDEAGVETNYEYNDSGLPKTVTKGTTRTTYAYDDLKQLTSVKVNDDTKATYAYDNNGNQTSYTDASGNEHKTSYDNADRVSSETTGSSTVKYLYTGESQVSQRTDGNGGVTKYAYDNLGNVTSSTSANGKTTKYTYDTNGNVLSSVSPSGHETSYTYDDNNNVTTKSDANGNVTKYEYNADGRLTKTTDALGYITTNSYNNLGLLTETKNNRGQTLYKYSYDSNGQLTALTDGNGNTQSISYDTRGNVIDVKDGYGKSLSQKTYTDLSQVATSINALNAKTSYDYNDSNTTVTTTDPRGNQNTVTSNLDGQITNTKDNVSTANASYTATGNIARQSVDGKNKTNYTYDNNDNVTSENNNDGSVSYKYNSDDELIGWVNARKQATDYTLDDDGNVTSSKATDIDNSYTYDKNGNELTADNNNAKVTKTYDALNRVVASTTKDKTVKCDYDDLGNLSKLTYPDGKTATYDYDVMGRMLSVTDWANHKTTYSYDKNNRIIATNYFNGVVENRSYDKAGQVTDIKTLKGSAVIDNHHYGYDSNGNLIKGDTSYEYDNSNRLTSGLSNYTYDSVGNITAGGKDKFTYDSDSRLTAVDGKATVSDADGNLTNYTLNGTVHTASYNSQNQLTRFDSTTYSYDANGNRLYNGAVYANGQLLVDSNYTYVYGANGLISFSNSSQTYINAYNNRGDVTKTIDSNSNVSGTIKYNDYGAVTSQTGVVSTFKYAGQYGAITDDNGLVYLKTRYYNPQLMRFMNRDTVAGSITDSQSLNRFSYVEGNPLAYVDLNGQARTWLTSYNGLHGMLDILGFIPVLGNVTALVNIGLDIATGNYDAIMADAMGLLPMGHILGAVGGVAIAHFTSPLVAKLGAHVLAHSNAIRKFLAPIDNHGNKVLSRTFFKKGTNEIDWARLAPNNGELKGSVTSDFTIQTNEKLDRYFSKGFENGRFFGNAIDDFEKRSLPYFEEDMEYQAYKVIKPISGVRRSIAAPAFTRDGGAVQYFIENMDVNYLIENSFIKRI